MIIHLPGQPVVNQIIKIGIRSGDFDDASAFLNVLLVLPLSEREAILTGCIGSQEETLADSCNLLLIMSGPECKAVIPLFARSKANAVLQYGYGRFIARFPVSQQSAF